MQAVRKLSAALMWRNGQRVELACPGDTVALSIESSNENYTSGIALAGRSEHGAVKPGGEVLSLPIHGFESVH